MLPALGVFLFTRVLILFFYHAYVTDVAVYFDWATQASQGLKYYSGFFYPYPPLSLPLMNLPMFFHPKDFWEYRNIFNQLMVLIDVAVFLMLAFFVRDRLKWKKKKEFQVLTLYSILSLFMGHLIYDRIDLGIVVFTLLAVIVGQGSAYWQLVLTSNLGFLFKLVPTLPAGFLLIDRQKHFKSVIIQGLALFVPAFIILVLMDFAVYPGLLGSLFSHAERGIQIESVWATPWMLAHTFFGATSGVATSVGAQHLVNIPVFYESLSKFLGIAIMGWFAWMVWRNPRSQSDEARGTLILCVFLVFLSTQRVFSPQFLIWTLPWVSIYCFTPGVSRVHQSLLVGVYILTYIGFDLGYWKFVEFHPFFVVVVALRNLVLVLATFLILKRLGYFAMKPKRS